MISRSFDAVVIEEKLKVKVSRASWPVLIPYLITRERRRERLSGERDKETQVMIA